MTRKAKIGMVVAGMVVGGAVFGLWPRGEEGELKISVVPVGSNQVVITITNSSKTSFRFSVFETEYVPRQGHVWSWERYRMITTGEIIASGTRWTLTTNSNFKEW